MIIMYLVVPLFLHSDIGLNLNKTQNNKKYVCFIYFCNYYNNVHIFIYFQKDFNKLPTLMKIKTLILKPYTLYTHNIISFFLRVCYFFTFALSPKIYQVGTDFFHYQQPLLLSKYEASSSFNSIIKSWWDTKE